MKRHSWNIAGITVAVLIVATYTHDVISRIPQYERLHNHRPFYFAESIDKIIGAALCILTVWLMYRTDLRGVGRELGLSAPVLPAIAFALVASIPMLIGFLITRSLSPQTELLPLLFLTVLSPLVEEIQFRGFGVRQLQRGTAWPFWLAVWPSTLLFGLGHVEWSESPMERAGLFLLTGVGGLTLAWLVYRWQNLWFAVALHICMNLWWELFSVAKNAIGGWFPFVLQGSTTALAVIITLYLTRSPIASRN